MSQGVADFLSLSQDGNLQTAHQANSFLVQS